LDLFGICLLALAVLSAVWTWVRPDGWNWWSHRSLFVLLLAGALFVFQRDAIRANFQLWNPDESEMIAGALTLQERPVFWRDVDGTTHGPLDQWPLLLPAFAGGRIDYTSTRLVSAGIIVLLLLSLQAALAGRLKEGTARLLVLPAWALFIFNQDPETAQYSSELMPSLLLLLAVAWWPRAIRPEKSGWCWAIGAAAGAAPLAKLQAAPLAAWILVFVQIFIWRGTSGTPDIRWRKTALLILGAATPVLFFVGIAAFAGAFRDFLVRYLETNIFSYALNGERFFNNARPSPEMIFGFSQFLWPVVGAIVLAGAIAALRRWRLAGSDFAMALGLVAAAAFAIYTPHKPFAHYFLLLVGPLILLLGAVAGPVLQNIAARLPPLGRALLAAAFLAVPCGLTIAHHFQNPDYFRFILRSRPPVSGEVVDALERHVAAGETLAVWGWQPALYVMTQTVCATPDLTIFWQILPNPWQEFYQSRYLRDLRARPPVVFVDTMGPSDFFFFKKPAATRHENFPALRDFIDQNFLLTETVAGCRVYVRRDRVTMAGQFARIDVSPVLRTP
jgi:hypothetical protein